MTRGTIVRLFRELSSLSLQLYPVLVAPHLEGHDHVLKDQTVLDSLHVDILRLTPQVDGRDDDVHACAAHERSLAGLGLVRGLLRPAEHRLQDLERPVVATLDGLADDLAALALFFAREVGVSQRVLRDVAPVVDYFATGLLLGSAVVLGAPVVRVRLPVELREGGLEAPLGDLVANLPLHTLHGLRGGRLHDLGGFDVLLDNSGGFEATGRCLAGVVRAVVGFAALVEEALLCLLARHGCAETRKMSVGSAWLRENSRGRAVCLRCAKSRKSSLERCTVGVVAESKI